MTPQSKLELWQAMVTAREVDRIEGELVARGEAFFHVSGAGHEAAAALAFHMLPDDYLAPHYRDKALMIARGLPAKTFFDGGMAKDAGQSRGRQMCAHISDRRTNLVSMAGPVGNAALHAVGIAAAVVRQDAANPDARPIVVCSVGDGTTQEGEFLESVAEAARDSLPVLFLVEDNHWAISTVTRERTFYDLPGRQPDEFHGVPIERLDGRDPVAAYERFGELVRAMRHERRPQIVVFECVRLTNHTNADDQTVYRDIEEIRREQEAGDPIRTLENHLRATGVSQETLDRLRAEIREKLACDEAASAEGPEPVALHTAKRPLPVELTHPSQEVAGSADGPRLTMRDALRETLRHHLAANPRVTLYGQDIADPKGDVFGVTKTLSTQFPGRVRNAPLTESTIVGTSIGRAMAGERPVAFIQFADFLPLAFNQIATDLGSMFWRTDGQWQCPVIVMVACGAYRAGLGPFHAHTWESVVAHVPGIDVFMPSNAADAVGLLNAAFASHRPTLFFYPKSCLNDPERTTSGDIARQFVPIGPARKVRVGRDLTLVGWGNTVRLCEQVATALEQAGVETEVLDLRSLSPWDEHAVVRSAEKTANLLVVHEDNQTCGFGAEILAVVSERARVPVAMRRVTRSDTYVPFHFGNQIEILPSFKRILTVAAELLDLDLSWIAPPQAEEGVAFIEAIGSGPSDETVNVIELHVQPGATIRRGDTVASLEATKSVFELTASVAGVLDEVLVREGDTVPVGAKLLKLRVPRDVRRSKPVTQEQSGTPVLSRKPAERLRVPRREGQPRQFAVGMSAVESVEGSRLVTNLDLFSRRLGLNGGEGSNGHGMTADDIVRRTGIESRRWVNPGEDAVSLAVKACWRVLDRERLTPDDIDLVICSTTSPTSVTPSMACRVLNGLTRGKTDAMIQAYDINAACSGYLYALQAGFDYLQSTPHGRALIVTTEVLSPLLDPNDFDTAILFGDAASATLLHGEEHCDQARWRLHRPELSAKGDGDGTLSVPLLHDGFIQMKGRKVFTEAVRSMVASLLRVCQREGLAVNDLRMVVPHQANQRILDAIQSRIGVDVYSNIREHGNTSSTSIPLCLSELLPSSHSGDRFGLCAFGGGFTFGAGILQAN